MADPLGMLPPRDPETKIRRSKVVADVSELSVSKSVRSDAMTVGEHASQREPGRRNAAKADRRIENVLLGARWLLLPFYTILLLVLLPLLAMLGRELIHLLPLAYAGNGSDVILAILSMLDLVLLANLVMMVAVSSFESYVSRIEVEPGADKPEWLGRLDAGDVKVKVAVSITMIAAVHLLRDFMQDADPRKLIFSGAVLLVFVVVAFVVARTGSHGNSHR